MAKITINGISIDPTTQGPALASARLARADSSSSNYILIQTREPLDKTKKAELTATGAELLEYVPENTYICRFLPADLGPIRALPFVAWANVYMPGFKVSPRLRSRAGGVPAADLLTIPATERSISKHRRMIEIVLHRGVSPDDVRSKIADAAGVDADALEITAGKVRLEVDTSRLDELAAIDEVRHIEEFAGRKLHNNIALAILRADVVQSESKLEGKDQVIAICDTGFDKGSTTDVHPAFKNRVVKLYPLGRATASDPDGHGTHVAGSVLGDGESSVLGVKIRGTAPQAKLVLQSVLDSRGSLGGLPLDLHDLFEAPYTSDGARVHTNSWGDVNGDGSYTQSCHELDDFAWKHRDCIILFAAGNDGTDRNANGVVDQASVGAPGTAKNCITVGACESERPDFRLTYGQGWPNDYPAEPIASDPVADDSDGMAAFSSRGPTKDGRIKPDLVAPGTAILSTRSRATRGKGWGLSEDPAYMFEGGTSMATPLVAGCAAVVREYLVGQRPGKSPSGALVKAMLINGAKNIGGQYHPSEAATLPNISEGFGRVDLAATIGPFGSSKIQYWDEDVALDSGEEQKFTVHVPSHASAVKVTLVWTDPPGETLQNDLDLVVRSGGKERHGNVRANSKKFDRRNNVEQVVLPDVPSGTDVEIVVRAFRAAIHPQTFALVARITH